MVTIRDVVKFYTETKAEYLNISYEEACRKTSLCFIFEMNNGTKCFIDMHPECEYSKEEPYKYERPNKKGVFKKYTFEIIEGEKIQLPKSMDGKYIKVNSNKHLKYIVDTPIKEKQFNEFISLNDGVNFEKFKKERRSLFKE